MNYLIFNVKNNERIKIAHEKEGIGQITICKEGNLLSRYVKYLG